MTAAVAWTVTKTVFHMSTPRVARPTVDLPLWDVKGRSRDVDGPAPRLRSRPVDGEQASAGDADRLLGDVLERGLRGADHAGPVLVRLLVADDHADVAGLGELLDRLGGVRRVQRVEALDRQLVGGDVAELLASGA